MTTSSATSSADCRRPSRIGEARWVAPLVDAIATATCAAAAYFVAFEFGRDERFALYARQWLVVVAPLVILRWASAALLGVYRSYPHRFSFREATRLVAASILGSALFLVVGYTLQWWGDAAPIAALVATPLDSLGDPLRVPFRVHAIEAMLSLLAFLGWRGLARWATLRYEAAGDAGEHTRVAILGTGVASRAIARQLDEGARPGWRAVAFVSLANDAAATGRILLGVPVVASNNDLGRALADRGVSRVIAPGDEPRGAELRRIAAALAESRVELVRMGSVADPPSGATASLVPRVAAIRPEELLGRPSVAPTADDSLTALVADATVLVTGAGGSIGAALCRRLLDLGAGRVIAVGRGENSLHQLRLDLEGTDASERVDLQVVDVRNETAMRALLHAARPSLVLHAAAHKHVVLMEAHPAEAWANNVAATRMLARLAREAEVGRFVLISSDKAVAPTSVMGATKRWAEWMLAEAARDSAAAGAATRYCAVRFGNVLGSRGSVVPAFAHRIERGLPLRVSHPDAERYFMTIEEAAALVLSAAALGDNGALYLLEMGEPVRILELARAMIALAGRSEAEVPIEITGLQPGEKLTEALVTTTCPAEPTSRSAVLRAAIDAPDSGELAHLVTQVEQALAADSPAEAQRRAILAPLPDVDRA